MGKSWMLVLAALASSISFGLGTAAADNEFAGVTFETALGQAARTGGEVRIAGRVGEYLPTEKCMVTRSRTAQVLDASGRGRTTVYLYLNCNDVVAGAHAGNSAMTTEGKEAKRLRDKSVELSDDFAKATAAGEAPICEKYRANCVWICNESGACSGDLGAFLGL